MLRLQRWTENDIVTMGKGGRRMTVTSRELGKMSLFAGIREEELSPMLHCLQSFEKSYQKGELILLESHAVRNVGLILTGTVHMVKEDEEGGETLILSMKEGELFGESFSCGSHMDARVSFLAAAPSTILFLPFHRVIHTCNMTCTFHHRLIENMVRMIGDKNVQLMRKIEIISQKTLREKVLTYLRLQAETQQSQRVNVPLGRVELADYLCANRSALTRELAAMKQDGILDYDKNVFVLLKGASLASDCR